MYVLHGNGKSTLYVDGPSKMEALEGHFYGTTGLDVAVLKLGAV
jgi:hypothetical protein